MRASVVSTSLLISLLTTVSASPAPRERFPSSVPETAAVEFPSVTDGPPLAIVQKRQATATSSAGLQTASISSASQKNASASSTSCNPTPSCTSLANSDIACGANFDNPNTPYCSCNNGCSYTATVTSNPNGICDWSSTPIGNPMTVDCTSIPQTAIPGPNKCPYDQWNPTVSNWLDANVDGELSSFFLDEVTDAPTYIKGTYPTKLPRIGTGPGSNEQAVGYPGKLISAAAGSEAVDCSDVIGGMAGCHPPPSVDDACGNIPRWAFLAWNSIWNMVFINSQIYAILESVESDVFGQLGTLTANFSLAQTTPTAAQIFLSVLGAIATIAGVLIPLTSIGVATTALVDAATIAAVAERGSEALAAGETANLPRSLAQPVVVPADDPSPDAINPVSNPISNPTEPAAGPKVEITQTPVGDNPKIGHPTFIGNAAWVTPGTLTNLGNTVWSKLEPQSNPLTLLNAVESNAANYFYNQKNITYGNNNYLGGNYPDIGVATALLNLHAEGTFIAAQWSPDIFQNVLSADIISREINGLWRTSGANTYVSYTFLDDDVNATKCLGPNTAPSGVTDPGDKNGPPSTKYCADGGVYYLNKLSQTDINTAQIVAPNGLDSVTNFGIYPWFPSSGSSRAYRAENPNSAQTPVYDTPGAEAAYNAYVSDFAVNHTGNLMDLIGQTPGSWSLPVCDQGYNTWTFDYTNSGGLQLPDQDTLALPCACGHQGSGTANFYSTLHFNSQTMQSIASECEMLLLNVAEGLDVTTENIGWNAISGGAPKSIVFDSSNTITAPNNLPTQACSIGSGVSPCPIKPPTTQQETQCQEHPNSNAC